jgi:deoxyribodipyrimidine photo-lyase
MPTAEEVANPRVRFVNRAKPDPTRQYVLYWMQMYRRLERNHALDYAIARAVEFGKPLVVYEGLRLDYPWASVRHHRFILEGMRANARRAKALGINYWPFVQTPTEPGTGLLRRLARLACLVVTDDYPTFIVPRQTQALALRAPVAVVAVDSNGVVPLSWLGPPVAAAAHLRPRIHRAFARAWPKRAAAEPDFPAVTRPVVEPPFAVWDATQPLDRFLDSLPLDRSVPAVPGIEGGAEAAARLLQRFLREKLHRYATERNTPDSPADGPASGLSPYLHYGHISIEAVVEATLNTVNGWSLAQVGGSGRDFYSDSAEVNAFLDEAITWRDVGYHWHWHRAADVEALERALPAWAWATLQKHASDRREAVYSLEQFEAGQTHDEIWNLAQRELVATGRIHNYMRMLWGKKILEWSATPTEAYRIMVELNNKYALDGRDPNSWTGILWTLGLFDRPWAPERPVFGTVRYMSSDNTSRKFKKLVKYRQYVQSLPEIAAVRRG